MKKLFTFALILSGISLLLALGLFLTGSGQLTALPVVGGLLLLALGVKRSPATSSLSYTVLILSAVSVAMYQPQWFLKWGDFELKRLIIPLLQIIMFGMGSQSSLEDFAGIAKNPKGVLVGIASHYLIMPSVGFLLAVSFPLPPEIATGIILVGCSPSGLASNVMAYIARANVPLSVTVTAFSTLLSPVLTPALLQVLAGAFLPVDFWKMVMEIFNITILPIVAGLLFNALAYPGQSQRSIVIQIAVYLGIILLKNTIALQEGATNFAETVGWNCFWFIGMPLLGGWLFQRLAGGKREIMDRVLSSLSMAGITTIIVVITAAGQQSLLQVGLILVLACFLHNTLGYFLGYWSCRLVGLSEQSSRSVAFEVGMQNAGMASGLALQMGQLATTGLAPAVFGPLMNTTGSMLANWWRTKPPREEEPVESQPSPIAS
ncbi:bile acid:sodium symporter family protein [Siphonobacter sp. SORGH_AS_1065]|uniref:bile acid:sodium symporter family protein n=1 Tax=Siphonobacter sp. SORGH_AS_1065 TaxID=3041795 RepID=UPI002781026E|nr:bile acid:sodium symporter family protein [Siphonobacter sp. SORGH_AS_1065]MDQ1086518.1 BASS family bile acid:Na+ symporter [Siphonobacter sp. SORGH_AS_1065]